MHELNRNQVILDYIESNEFGRYLGMEFEILEPGVLEYKMKIGEHHLATPRACHGGVVTALLDGAVGTAGVSLVCEAGKTVATVEIKITFFAPVLLGDNLLARTLPLKKGNRLIFMEASITNQRNELVAKASATCNAYPKEKAGYKN